VRRMIVFVGVLIVAVAAVVGQQPFDNLGDDPAQFDQKLEAATLRHDTTFFQTVLSADVRFTHGTGDVWDKHQWLEMVPKSTATIRTLDSLVVEAHGDVVETVGHIQVKSEDPKSSEYHVWYVRVYARRNGIWQLLSNRTVRFVNGPLSVN
jgi:hypothetical protein